MPSKKPQRSRGKGIKAAMIARRSACLDKILEMLKVQPMITGDIIAAIGVGESTCYSYLRILRDKKNLIQMNRQRDANGAAFWTIGAGKPKVAKSQPADRDQDYKCTVPARQMGMTRDPLIAALFGPAGERRA